VPDRLQQEVTEARNRAVHKNDLLPADKPPSQSQISVLSG
jgi:hypothetical protein